MKKRAICLMLAALMMCSVAVGCNTEESAPTTQPISQNLPEYTAGNITKTQIDEETVLTHSTGSTLAEFDKYCADMETVGYTKLSTGDSAAVRYTAFLDGDRYIYAYYSKKIMEARIITGPKDSYSTEACKSDTGVSASPSLTMLGQAGNKNNGQGFLFVLPDGRLILQDGGHWDQKGQPDRIYEAIKSLAPDPDHIVIAAWFISHPHDDHVGAFLKFATDHGADETVYIERVIVNFAGASWYDFQREDGTTENCGKYVNDLYALCRDNLPTTQVIKAHTGQVFDFGETKVEILHTVEDLLPAENLGYVNASSMVIRVNIAQQSVLLLGDSTSSTCVLLEDMYDDLLASEMVQLAHHGMWAGTEAIYFYVQAPVLLWPTLPSVADDWLTDKPVISALTHAKDVYIAGTERTTLQLPYNVVGNKKQVLSAMT